MVTKWLTEEQARNNSVLQQNERSRHYGLDGAHLQVQKEDKEMTHGALVQHAGCCHPNSLHRLLPAVYQGATNGGNFF